MEPDEHSTIVRGRDLPISTKHAVEICSFIRGKSLQKSKKALQEVMDKKIAVPFKRFNKDTGHKPGRMAAGRYPYKASQKIFDLLASLEANAQNKGLDINSLHLVTVIANKASCPMRPGRRRGRSMRRTHIDIIAEEKVSEKKKEAKKEIKPEQKKEQKAEAKK